MRVTMYVTMDSGNSDITILKEPITGLRFLSYCDVIGQPTKTNTLLLTIYRISAIKSPSRIIPLPSVVFGKIIPLLNSSPGEFNDVLENHKTTSIFQFSFQAVLLTTICGNLCSLVLFLPSLVTHLLVHFSSRFFLELKRDIYMIRYW